LAVDDIGARAVHDLLERFDGAMTFRLFLQPVMASVLAARDGFRDARHERRPYGWLILTDHVGRKAHIRNGWRSIRHIFFLALAVDAVYQFIELRWIYPGEALITAEILALVPYVCLRGVSNRIARLCLGEKYSHPS
jgi:hypothetical protein